MSKRAKTSPAATPTTYPISPQEAVAYGRLLAAREGIEQQIRAIGAQACARLGLALDTPLQADLDRGVYVRR